MQFQTGPLEPLDRVARRSLIRLRGGVTEDNQIAVGPKEVAKAATQGVAGLRVIGPSRVARGRDLAWGQRWIARSHDRVANQHQLDVKRGRVLRPALQARPLKILNQAPLRDEHLGARITEDVEAAVVVEE